jgi:hypothetical protein
MRTPVLLVAVFPLILACANDATAPNGIDLDERSMAVTAQVEGSVLVLRNAADVAVRVSVVEQTTFDQALVSWCFGADECGVAVPAGSELRVPLSAVQGYSASATELAVFWWNPSDPNRVSGESAPVAQYSVSLS